MTSVMATLQTTQPMLLGNLIPPHCTDNIQTAIWFVKEVADTAQNAGLLLAPNKLMEVSQLKLTQVMNFAKENMDQFPIYHKHRLRLPPQMHLGHTNVWWVKKMEWELGRLLSHNPMSRDKSF